MGDKVCGCGGVKCPCLLCEGFLCHILEVVNRDQLMKLWLLIMYRRGCLGCCFLDRLGLVYLILR